MLVPCAQSGGRDAGKVTASENEPVFAPQCHIPEPRVKPTTLPRIKMISLDPLISSPVSGATLLWAHGMPSNHIEDESLQKDHGRFGAGSQLREVVESRGRQKRRRKELQRR